MWMRVDFRIEKEKSRCSIQTEKKVYVIVICSMSPFHQLKSLKKITENGITLLEKKTACTQQNYHLTATISQRLICAGPTIGPSETSFFLTLSPSEIIATINFDNAREQRHSLKKKKRKRKK